MLDKSTEEDVGKRLETLLKKYLTGRVDAYQWLLMYRHFCHAIDDIIDVADRRNDNEFLLLVFNKALDVLSHPFYQANIARLHSVIKVIHNTYADSVKWENHSDRWRAHYADVIRCCTNEMLTTVVEIVVTQETGSFDLGYEAKRQVSLLAREKSWFDHHDEKGQPI